MIALARRLACRVLRALAASLHGTADMLERHAGGCLPLEPVRIVVCADDVIDERRHRIYSRYY